MHEKHSRYENLCLSRKGSAERAAAHLLRELMSDISEDHYCAGWLMGLEYRLFDAAYAGDDFGFGLTHNELSKLITLSQQCQGWWVFEGFVDFDEWLPMYAQRYQSC